jgi:hypothetical protein
MVPDKCIIIRRMICRIDRSVEDLGAIVIDQIDFAYLAKGVIPATTAVAWTIAWRAIR